MIALSNQATACTSNHLSVSFLRSNFGNYRIPYRFIIAFPAHDTIDVSMAKLITSFNLCGSEVQMKIEPFCEIPSDNLDHETVKCILCNLFFCNPNGYFRRDRECWALFKRGKAFYILDPLGIEVKEKKMTRRRATLYKFNSIDLLVTQLMTSLVEIFGVECQEVCKLGAFNICSSKPASPKEKKIFEKPVKKIKKSARVPPSKSFFNQAMALLRDIKPICEEPEDQFVDCFESTDDFCAN